MKDLIDILDNEIYPNLDRAELLHELNTVDKGGNFALDCPQCNDHSAFTFKNGPFFITCNHRNHCGFNQSIWEYLKATKGWSTSEILKELARRANYNLATSYSEDKFNQAECKDKILRIAVNIFRRKLTEPEGKEVLTYLLEKRQLNHDAIEIFEIGYYPPQKELKDYLSINHKDIILDEFGKAGLFTEGFGETYKLIIPWKDRSGRIIGLIGRAICQEIKQKYKYSSGLSKDVPFNLNKIVGKREIIITEGILDAITPVAKGLPQEYGVIAIGCDKITEPQLDSIVRKNFKHLYLAFDQDPPGKKATERAIMMLQKRGINSFIINLGSHKDPDEFVVKEGILAFQEAIRTAESDLEWLCERMLEKHDISTNSGKRDAFGAAELLLHSLKHPVEQETVKSFIGKEIFCLPAERLPYLEESISSYSMLKNKEENNKEYVRALDIALKLGHEGKYDESIQSMEKKIAEIKAKSSNNSSILAPYNFEDLQRDVANIHEGFITGYSELDKIVRIQPGAITIIAGRPSHGKTTLMMNILSNVIGIYPNLSFIYFTYEESRIQICLKLISIFCAEPIDNIQNYHGYSNNLTQISHYIKNHDKINPVLETGTGLFKEYVDDKRLWVIDESYYIDTLINQLYNFKNIYPLGAVFVDYIQKIKTTGRFGTRQLELQKISGQLLEASTKLSIPIILGCQLGRDKEHKNKVRLDNMREAGDIEQDANLVIGIYNDAMQKAQDEGKQLLQPEVDLKLTVLKNRNGEVNQEIHLSYNRPIWLIKGRNENEAISTFK